MDDDQKKNGHGKSVGIGVGGQYPSVVRIWGGKTANHDVGIEVAGPSKVTITNHTSVDEHIALYAYDGAQLNIRDFLAIRRRNMSNDELSKGFVIRENVDSTIKDAKAIGFDRGFDIIANKNLMMENPQAISHDAHIGLQKIEELRLLLQSFQGDNADLIQLREVLSLTQSELSKEKPSKFTLTAVEGYLAVITADAITDMLSGKFGDLASQIAIKAHELWLIVQSMISSQ